MENGPEQELVAEMQRHVRRWKGMFRVWIALHYTMGSLAVMAPLAIGSTALGGEIIASDGALALLAACAAGLVTFLRPDKYALGFFSAYNTLEIALKRYRWDADRAPDTGDLVDAFEIARGFITRMQPDQAARRGT